MCRRKKIKCDGEYVASLGKVTKTCTNCLKNTDVCTFSRIPLKRGPSKGFARELASNADKYGPTHHTLVMRLDRPRSKSVDIVAEADLENAASATNATRATPVENGDSGHRGSATSETPSLSSPHTNPFARFQPGPLPDSAHARPGPPEWSQLGTKPALHRVAYGPAQPIILPPLLGTLPLTQPVKMAVPLGMAPGGPGMPLPADIKQNTTRIQGPLWKVPYEMPTSSTAATTSPPGAGSRGFDLRRLSVDLISSVLSVGLRLRLPSLKPLASASSDLESEDDYLLARSRGLLASASPRNSILSLSSLTGRVAHQLSLGPSPGPESPKPSPAGNAGHVGGGGYVSSAPTNGSPGLLNPRVGLWEHCVRVYYSKFHPSMPILPHSEQRLMQIVATASQSPQTTRVSHALEVALANLVSYPVVPLESLIDLLRHVLSLYPFSIHNVGASDDILTLMFASVVLISYTILLNGDFYLAGIALAASVFTDFKVLENFCSLDSSTVLDPDDIHLYLPRLYLCLSVIDGCHSLSFGCQAILADNFAILADNFDRLKVKDAGLTTFRVAAVFNALVLARKASVLHFQNAGAASTPAVAPALPSVDPAGQEFPLMLLSLLRSKVDLADYLRSFQRGLTSQPAEDLDDLYDSFYDYQFKLTRLTKKVSQALLNYINCVSSIYSLKPPANFELVNPFFNMVYGQCFKLIKLCKTLVDSLVLMSSDNEITSRGQKITKDLSIAYNLLTSNLANHVNAISALRNLLSMGRMTPLTPGIADRSEAIGLGSTSLGIISSKLEFYNLKFTTPPPEMDESGNSRDKKLVAWKRELTNAVKTYVIREDIDGWY